VQPQPLHRLAADEMLLDDLVHVLLGDAAVPHALRVDHNGAPQRTVVQAPRLVGADFAVQPARPQRVLELLEQRRASFRSAVPLGMSRLALVEADEDVLLEGRRHQGSPVASAARKAAASWMDSSRNASARPPGGGESASTRVRGGTLRSNDSSATTGARSEAARPTSSLLSQTMQATMCVLSAACRSRASDSGVSARAYKSTASAP